jgi:hypothetical protein
MALSKLLLTFLSTISSAVFVINGATAKWTEHHVSIVGTDQNGHVHLNGTIFDWTTDKRLANCEFN